MIDNIFIDNAKSIRNEFLSLNKKLDIYKDDIQELSAKFLETSSELEEYNKNEINTSKDVNTIESYIVEKLNYLESESNKILLKIEPINKKIENLKKDELNLYNKIKSSYPNMSDEDIKLEIHSKLNN